MIKIQDAKGHFFHEEMAKGFYMISCPEWEWAKANVNSWMIVGEKEALLVDAGQDIYGLREYAETLAGKPVRLYLSHGHFDHTGALDEFDEFWMHPADEPLLKGGEGMPPARYHGVIHPVYPDTVVDLGNRKIRISGVEGHTKGSLVFFDEESRILISGDSVSRRLFYIEAGNLSIKKYFEDLTALDALDISAVASAHDRFLLPADQNHYLIQVICEGIKNSKTTWKNEMGEFLAIHAGKGAEDPKYISCSIPVDKIEIIKNEITLWEQENCKEDVS